MSIHIILRFNLCDDDDVMWVFTTSTVTPSLRSVIDTAVARITCVLLHHDRGYVDVTFFFIMSYVNTFCFMLYVNTHYTTIQLMR